MKDNIIQIDRNISKQSSSFVDKYTNTSLALDLLFYMSKKAKSNIFYNKVFFVKDFADYLGYTTTNLNRKTKNDSFLNRYESEGLSSVFDELLVEMSTKSFAFTNNYFDKENDEFITEFKTFKLIEEFKKSKSASNKNKVRYEININNKLIKNINFYFTVIDSTNLKKLRKKNLYLLYLRLLELKQTCFKNKTYSTIVYYTTAKELLNINIKEFKDEKKKVNLKFKELAAIAQDLDFEYSFTNIKNLKTGEIAGPRRYNIMVRFKSFKNINNDAVFSDNIRDAFTSKLKDMYKIFSKDVSVEGFKKFINDSSKEKDFKEAYNALRDRIGTKIPYFTVMNNIKKNLEG